MGGDFGPAAAVAGAAMASLDAEGVHVVLTGPAEVIQRELDLHPHDPRRLSLLDAGPPVPMDADPRAALERCPEASIAVATRLLREGGADGLVSAGHTGATVLSAASQLERIAGVHRAALAAVVPTEAPHGPRRDPFSLMLDVGATLHVTGRELVEFAIMGAAYSSIISGIREPSVALLSNGTEPGKGPAEVVEAHRVLSGVPVRFVGNVEGLDIPRGTADVFVCEGYVGNVVLKMLEGVADVFRELAVDAAARHLKWKLGLSMLEGGMRRLHRVADWEHYGGSPLLGFEQVIIKAHGRSGPVAIRNAIKVSAKAVEGGLARRIAAGIESLEEAR
ncbi:MAG: phosphate acyltransferase PlsX [Deltaproteobacteria bacterium]|nr:phosphate acyltransferase PlsX [Deltaproteobacteria bacterium]